MATDTGLVRTTILVLSDTHGAIPEWALDGSLTVMPDAVIHCGDLSSTGKVEEHQRTVKLLKALPGPLKIVIPGNHDLTLDGEYCRSHPRMHGWKEAVQDDDLRASLDAYTNQDALDAGIFYLVEGFKKLVLANGAELTIYANAYTPEFCDWAFAYPRPFDRTNAASTPGFPHKDDKTRNPSPTVFVTHGPPRGILDMTIRGEHVGCDELLDSVTSYRPLLHCFGHIHEAHGSESWRWSEKSSRWNWLPGRGSGEAKKSTLTTIKDCSPYLQIDMTDKTHGRDTVFVNASIMTVRYKPAQQPFLITLNLPQAT